MQQIMFQVPDVKQDKWLILHGVATLRENVEEDLEVLFGSVFEGKFVAGKPDPYPIDTPYGMHDSFIWDGELCGIQPQCWPSLDALHAKGYEVTFEKAKFSNFQRGGIHLYKNGARLGSEAVDEILDSLA
jgi:hypothetical protein